MERWQGVTEFVAVVDANSFTGAAKQLDVSVAHVSRKVNTLEQRLGAKLFYRSTRKVTLTESGNLYYQHCRQLLVGLEEADRAVADLNGDPRGLLKMTAPVFYGEHFVAPLVNQFLCDHPELRLEFTLTNEKLDLISQGYDLAIRLGKLEDSSLIARKIGRRTQYVCGSPDYFHRYGQPHTLGELSQHQCLHGSVDVWRFLEHGQEKYFRVHGQWRCNSGLALKDASLRGLGLVQLPDYYVEKHFKRGELVSVLDQYRLPDDGIWAVYPQNRHLSPKVRLLVEYLILCSS
ncbi:LysR substrate-binding domain-containing protein [Kistimonas scapharcae]|uniref:LysR substrate-binding domain-containing protein n=1 Tax=Kistimonas scapharcae TaxID=1036133 RepID=A0ABP8UZ81_9GAMM